MFKLLFFILLLTISVHRLTGNDVKNFVSIIQNLKLWMTNPPCTGTPPTYWLYSQKYKNKPLLLSSLLEIQSAKPIKVLIHGWMGNRDKDYIQVIKNAYLQLFDYNIIVIDWSSIAQDTGILKECGDRFVGKNLADFLLRLHTQLVVPLNSIHLIGQSVGAHVAGIAGMILRTHNKYLGRITGLDPAGLIYLSYDPSLRLDETDALFVDVIHTNQKYLGFYGKCGHKDFYVDCGFHQIGCQNKTTPNASIMEKLAVSWFESFCSHNLASYFFADSIIHNNLIAFPCLNCHIESCSAMGQNDDVVKMGEFCTFESKFDTYVVFTERLLRTRFSYYLLRKS